MAITYVNQMRLRGVHHFGEQKAIGTSLVKVTCDNLNNYKAYTPYKIACAVWPAGAVSASGGDEAVLDGGVLPPVFVPDGFDLASWAINAKRTSGAGETTFRLYLAQRLYAQQQQPVLTHYMGVAPQSDSITVSSGTMGFQVQQETIQIVRDADGLIWPILTAASSDGSTLSKIYSLDVWLTDANA